MPKMEELSRVLPRRSGLRKKLKKLPALIPEGEEVLQVDTATHLGRTGLLVATDRRVLFVPAGPTQSRLDLSFEEIVALKPRIEPECGPCGLTISTYDDQIELCDLSRPAVDRIEEGWRSRDEAFQSSKQADAAREGESQDIAVADPGPNRDEPSVPAALSSSPLDPDVTAPLRGDVSTRSDPSLEQQNQVGRRYRVNRVLYALAVLSLLGLIAELTFGGRSISVLTGNTPPSTTSTTLSTTTTTTVPPPPPVVVIPSTTEPVGPRVTARVTTTRRATTTTRATEQSTTTTEETTTTSERKKKKGS